MGYYRFLNNEQVSVVELSRSLSTHCQEQVSGRHVLSLSDTSEINLQAHVGRIKPDDVGVVGNNQDVGFWIHPSLVLEAESGFPLGLSDVKVWRRAKERPDKHARQYKHLAIEEKESYKWLESAQNSQHCVERGGSTMVTHIGDREADIYEEWVKIPSRTNHVLIRACRDRKLANGSTLFDYLSQQVVEGTYCFQVAPDPRRHKIQREAWMAVRFAKVQIQRPQRLQAADYPDSVSLYAVDVCEVQPPKGQSPVHWRLLTTHPVVCIEQALLAVRWYSWRWRIEQLFFSLKQGGLDLECSQLESGSAIERLCVFALAAALQLLQLTQGRNETSRLAAVAFSPPSLDFLLQLAPTLDGRTLKQRNPYPSLSLAWATWLIARLGGWSGLQSQRPPGSRTLCRGLRQFHSLFCGWSLAFPGFVYTP